MLKAIKLGARPSRLALRQAAEISRRLAGLDVEIVPIATRGDKDKRSSLFDREESDFFTDALEQALLRGEIDAAIHSAKDLEKNPPQGLIIAAVTRSISPFECLVSRGNLTLKELPDASVVGTSSRKRKEALLRLRPDLNLKSIRGDIDERLAQLERGEFDAIIIAHAALIRLGYEKRIAQVIPEEIIAPHPLQGRLAIQIRKDRSNLLEIFRSLDEK